MWQLVTGIFITVIFLRFMFGDSFDELISEIFDVIEVLFKLAMVWLVIWLFTLPVGVV